MIDLSPLRKNRNYRNLFLSQLISFFGTAIAQVSTGFSAYEITKSSLAVGLIGVFSLVPLSISGFIGGAWADHVVARTGTACVCESNETHRNQRQSRPGLRLTKAHRWVSLD